MQEFTQDQMELYENGLTALDYMPSYRAPHWLPDPEWDNSGVWLTVPYKNIVDLKIGISVVSHISKSMSFMIGDQSMAERSIEYYLHQLEVEGWPLLLSYPYHWVHWDMVLFFTNKSGDLIAQGRCQYHGGHQLYQSQFSLAGPLSMTVVHSPDRHAYVGPDSRLKDVQFQIWFSGNIDRAMGRIPGPSWNDKLEEICDSDILALRDEEKPRSIRVGFSARKLFSTRPPS